MHGTVRRSAAKAFALKLSASLAFAVFSAFAQDEENADDTDYKKPLTAVFLARKDPL